MDYFKLAKDLIEKKAEEVLEESGIELVECEICNKKHDIELSIRLGFDGDRYACCGDCSFDLEFKLDLEQEAEEEELACKNWLYDHR